MGSVFGSGGDFSDAVRSRWVIGPGHHHGRAMLGGHGGHLGTVGGDHALLRDAGFADPLPNAKHQWLTGEEAEGFSGEAGCSQPSWDDGERLHAMRLNALSGETVTPVECRVGRD